MELVMFDFVTFSIYFLMIVLKCSESMDLYDYTTIESYCHLTDKHKFQSEEKRICDCRWDTSSSSIESTWLSSLIIDCSFKQLFTEQFAEVLPMMATTLDASCNHIEQIPYWSGGRLQKLILTRNQIFHINKDNFINLTHLHLLDLSFNHLQTLEANAFNGLSHLQILDLSHNELLTITEAFQPLISLESLNLSANQYLNESITEAREVSGDIYERFQITSTLRALKLAKCNLKGIQLPLVNISLTTLDLRGNLLKEIPKTIPQYLRQIDLSDNLLESLQENTTQYLSHLKEIHMEDMPALVAIERYALRPLTAVKILSFENSRKLRFVDGEAFAVNTTNSGDYHLRQISFRGTSLTTLSPKLAAIFQQLEQLDLNGLPLHCDCNLIWLKALPFETNGLCMTPWAVRNRSLQQLSAADYQCRTNTIHWVYGFLILLLIIFFLIGLWCLVMGPKAITTLTSRRRANPTKHLLKCGRIGDDSPYARITITPKHSRKPLIL